MLPGYTRVNLRPLGINMRLPRVWRGSSKLIYVFREAYEPELALLRDLLRPGSVTIDVGANYGIYSATAARFSGDQGVVYAFEPSLHAFSVLVMNSERNAPSRINMERLAVASITGAGQLSVHRDSSRNVLRRAGELGGQTESVHCIELDRYIAEKQLTRVDLIKVDVEGAEELVLRGAAETIDRFRPVIIFEVNPDGARRLGLQESGAWNLLAERRYSLHLAESGALRPVTSPPPSGNVVALPA